mmetsp:Transcript_68443/g.108683  ORF Transcript_68443/g.108683 Transcript_68443/m.108683 type:complete len:200 (-) Transcript_68443:248-847(-)
MADSNPNLDEYYQQSASNCLCHKYMSCCTCRCCAFFIAIVWIISGLATASLAGLTLGWYETYETCPTYSGPSIGIVHPPECCALQISPDVPPVYLRQADCDLFIAAIVLSLIQSSGVCIAGVAAIVGLAVFISWLLLIPVVYCVISIVLVVVLSILSLIADGAQLTRVMTDATVQIVLAVLIAVLFYFNFKQMKNILGK